MKSNGAVKAGDLVLGPYCLGQRDLFQLGVQDWIVVETSPSFVITQMSIQAERSCVISRYPDRRFREAPRPKLFFKGSNKS